MPFSSQKDSIHKGQWEKTKTVKLKQRKLPRIDQKFDYVRLFPVQSAFGSKAANHKLTRRVFPLRSALRKEISQSESEFKIRFLCCKHFRPVFSAVCIFISLANHEKAAKISILKTLKALFENSACKGIIKWGENFWKNNLCGFFLNKDKFRTFREF